MSDAEEPHGAGTPEHAWTSQDEEQSQTMQITLTPGDLCALARAREKLNARVMLGVVIVTVALAGAFLYNVYRIDQPWVRLGQAWTLGVIVYLFGSEFERARRRQGASEPCARYLERQHDERRRGYLRIRRRLFLFIPGMLASWWGGGPLAFAKARGLAPSSRLFQFFSGPWPFLLAGTALLLVWLAFGKAAAKAAHDREEIRRKIGN